jgi:hypothetical protein
MNRDNHYEAAFEAFLRGRGVGFVPVDEARRSYLDAAEVKSPDFIIVGPADANLVVDVKGRQFPIGRAHPPNKSWQNWVQVADVDGLTRWTDRFGGGFRGVLAFLYHILPTVTLHPETPDLFTFRDRLYLARGVDVRDYREHMTPRSPSWDTVHVPMADFRRIVRPFSEFLKQVDRGPTGPDANGGRRESPSNPIGSRE